MRVRGAKQGCEVSGTAAAIPSEPTPHQRVQRKVEAGRGEGRHRGGGGVEGEVRHSLRRHRTRTRLHPTPLLTPSSRILLPAASTLDPHP